MNRARVGGGSAGLGLGLGLGAALRASYAPTRSLTRGITKHEPLAGNASESNLGQQMLTRTLTTMSAEESNPYQNLVGNGLSQLEADVLAEYKHLGDAIKEVSRIAVPWL